LEENDTEKILSRPPSRISNTSKSSSKNKTNENLIQETSTTESVDDTFSFDKQLHSLELSEHSHHSNQNQNEIMKSDTDLSDEEFESHNPPSKPKRQNETEGIFLSF
jgi:alpha-galactosidase